MNHHKIKFKSLLLAFEILKTNPGFINPKLVVDTAKTLTDYITSENYIPLDYNSESLTNPLKIDAVNVNDAVFNAAVKEKLLNLPLCTFEDFYLGEKQNPVILSVKINEKDIEQYKTLYAIDIKQKSEYTVLDESISELHRRAHKILNKLDAQCLHIDRVNGFQNISENFFNTLPNECSLIMSGQIAAELFVNRSEYISQSEKNKTFYGCTKIGYLKLSNKIINIHVDEFKDFVDTRIHLIVSPLFKINNVIGNWSNDTYTISINYELLKNSNIKYTLSNYETF